MSFIRSDGRAADEKRPLNLVPDYAKFADGSVLVELGDTRVLCTATVEEKVPPHAREVAQGWVTAEYSMLPRSSKQRIQREVTKGQIGGRTYEIQRFIGRSLRAVTDLRRLGERTIIIDCDVIQADGGTRTASITGGFIALAQAVRQLRREGKVGAGVLTDFLAATSVGIVEGHPVLDLNYIEDLGADVDMNVVETASNKYVEIQGTAEHQPFDDGQLAGYAMSVLTVEAELVAVLAELTARLPGPGVTQQQLRDRSWWSGPELYVIVDDYDLVVTSSGTPLRPLIPLLAQAGDVGLHVVLCRRSGGASRALYEPVIQSLRDLASPGIMLSSSPDEGALVGRVKGSAQPPGRGRLVSRELGDQVVQLTWLASAHE